MEKKVVDQKEYLRKYLSSGNGNDKKRKKKKKVGPQTVKIIDDDIDLKNMRPVEENEFDIFIDAEDAPQIAGVVDERGPVDFTDKRRWKIIANDEGGDLTITSSVKGNKKYEQAKNSFENDLSPSRKSKKYSDDDLSPLRVSKKQKGTTNKKSKKHEDNDMSPARTKNKSSKHKHQDSSDSDSSQQVEGKGHKSRKTERKKDRASVDLDFSPPRKSNKHKSEKRRKRKQKDDSDLDSPAKSRQNSDTDLSPPRKNKKQIDKYDSDLSPPRKTRKDSDADLSPPRKNRGHDSDLSPPRRSKNQRVDKNTKHRHRNDSDLSPPRMSRKNSDSDLSPPRNRKGANYDSDQSPPRRNNSGRRNRDLGPDLSLSKRKHERDFNEDFEYKGRRHESDFNPQRYNKSNRDSYSYTKNNKYHNSSPSRQHRYRNENVERHRNNKCFDRDYKSNRRYNDSDMSPPRKTRDVDTSSSRSKRDDRNYYEFKPSKLKDKYSRDSKYSYKEESARKGRMESTEDTEDIEDNENERSTDRMKKTLDGKKAGLQDARALREETEAHKKREAEQFSKLSKEVTGVGQVAVVRDTKTGKKRNLEAEAAAEREKQRRQAELDEKYAKWGRGLKQVEDHAEKLKDDLYEMTKPLARYADDADLDKMLRDQEREGDPMLEYIKQKQVKEGKRKPDRPTYDGASMPNRFGIKPGHRWDGVDRSCGYEKRWFEAQNAKVALQEEAYKWSTSDM